MLLLEFLQISKAGKIKQVPLLPVPRPLSIMAGPQQVAANTLECSAQRKVNFANIQS